jgi:hypothetical protein
MDAHDDTRNPRKGSVRPHGCPNITPIVPFLHLCRDRSVVQRSAQGTRVGLRTPLVVARVVKRMRTAWNHDESLAALLTIEGLQANAARIGPTSHAALL